MKFKIRVKGFGLRLYGTVEFRVYYNIIFNSDDGSHIDLSAGPPFSTLGRSSCGSSSPLLGFWMLAFSMILRSFGKPGN